MDSAIAALPFVHEGPRPKLWGRSNLHTTNSRYSDYFSVESPFMRSGGDRIQATEGKIIERPRNQPRQQKRKAHPPCFRTGETIDIENNQEASSCFPSKVFTTKKSGERGSLNGNLQQVVFNLFSNNKATIYGRGENGKREGAEFFHKVTVFYGY